MASRFWVGGTGTWDNATTTHWSATTGGAGGASVPVAGDIVTLDGSSGGGTVTPAAAINAGNSLSSITMTAFTGTLDFSANNPNLTLTGNGFTVGNGAEGTRTLNLGSGTFTLTGVNANIWDATSVASLTFNAGTSTILCQPSAFNGSSTFVTGGKNYATVTLGGVGFATAMNMLGNGATFGTLNINGAVQTKLPSMTITNAIAWAGTASAPVVINNATSATVSTITLNAAGNTIAWAALGGLTFATNTPVATNSFSMGNVTNATVNNPSAGGVGSHMIGG